MKAKLATLVISALSLAACGNGIPITDMTNVDQAKYSQDLAVCYKNPPFLAAGNYVANCLKAKGYNVLYDN